MKIVKIAGYVIHALLAAAMVAAGAVKQLPLSEETIQEMAKGGVTPEWAPVIGVGEIVTGILLVVPLTFSIGLLLMTGLCGGIIATNMTHPGQMVGFYVGIVFLALTWVGAWLRDPRTLCTCFCKKGDSP